MVLSALDFRSEGWWFKAWSLLLVVSLDKKLYSTLSLFTQVYKWVPVTMLGVALRCTSIPSRGGGVAIPLVPSCYKSCIKLWQSGLPVARLYLHLLHFILFAAHSEKSKH